MATTLTVSEILSDVLQSFKTRLPALNFFATDFSSETAKYGQTVIAHLPVMPTSYAHTAASGYSNNAQNARDLLTDVSVVINLWRDVPIKMTHDDVTEDRSQNYLKTIDNAGYVLAKYLVDAALAKAVAANFTDKQTVATASVNLETLEAIRDAMNGRNALWPRYGLINSGVSTSLALDSRIASGDFYGQGKTGDPFRRFENLAGFAAIQEYPGLPANSENLTGFFFDSRAIGIATRLPEDSTELAAQMGLPIGYKVDMLQDPETGLAIVAYSWIDTNTHDIYVVFSVMGGVVGGSQAGAPGALTDYSGHRLVSA